MVQIPDGKNEADRKLVLAKRRVEDLVFKLNNILKDKVLSQNKSEGQKKMENDIIQRLLMVCHDELDELNPSEGVYTLFASLIGEALMMKETRNILEYEMNKLNKKVEKLEKQIIEFSRAERKIE